MGVTHTEVNLLAMPSQLGPSEARLELCEDGGHLILTNHERPIVWKLDFAVPANKGAWANSVSASLLKDLPASPQTVVPPSGQSLAQGSAELGLQTSDECEYFLSKGDGLVGILRLKRKESGWIATVSKDLMPRVLSDEAVSAGIMPPLGKSALPMSLERVVPAEMQYWNAEGETARAARDALVESGFFSHDCLKVVNGEICKVEQHFYLYEPSGDEPKEVEMAAPPTLGDRVIGQLSKQLGGGGPLVSINKVSDILKHDEEGATLVISPETSEVEPVVKALSELTKAAWLVDLDDSEQARAQLSKLAPTFKLNGARSLMAASFPLTRPDEVQWVAKTGPSHDELRCLVSAALEESVYPRGEPEEDGWCPPTFWMRDMFNDSVVVSLRKDGKLYRHAWAYDKGSITLGEAEQVTMTYISVDEMRAVQQMRAQKAQAAGKDTVQKPFAGFDDFGACLASMKEQGKDDEAARKICAALQSEHKKANVSEHLVKLAGISKEDEERYVLGIVLEPEPFEGEGDAQNDTYSAEEVRTAAHNFMADFGNMGEMHKRLVNEGVKILESFLAPIDFDLGDQTIKKGTWLLGSRIVSDELWGKVKCGQYAGYSIGGDAIRTTEG